MICVGSNQIILLEAGSIFAECSVVLKIDLGTRVSPVKIANGVCVTAQNHITHKLKKQEKNLADKKPMWENEPSEQWAWMYFWFHFGLL